MSHQKSAESTGSGLIRSRCAKAVAIILRCHRVLLEKGTAQRLFVTKPCDAGNPFQRKFACLEGLSSGFNSQRLHPPSRRCSEVPLELTSESTRRHRDRLSEGAHGQLLCQSGFGPCRKIAQGCATHICLLCQQCAVLRLIAGTAQEENDFPSNARSNCLSMVFFDERQGKIDSGANTCGRIDFAISDIDRISLHPQMSVALDQLVDVTPVCRHPSSVKHTGGSEDECSCADRSNPVDMNGTLAHPLEHLWGLAFH